MKTVAELDQLVSALATLPPSPFPVLSVYLNLRPIAKHRYPGIIFLKKELSLARKLFAPRSDQARYLELDADGISRFVDQQIHNHRIGLTIFASAGDLLFESVALDLQAGDTTDENLFFIGDVPNIYPLVKRHQQLETHLVIVADSHSAKAFSLTLGTLNQRWVFTRPTDRQPEKETLGRSLPRLQRHIHDLTEKFAGAIVASLGKVLPSEHISKVVLAGEEIMLAPVRANLEKVSRSLRVTTIRADMKTPEHELVKKAIRAFAELEEFNSQARLRDLLDLPPQRAVLGQRDSLLKLKKNELKELLLWENLHQRVFLCEQCVLWQSTATEICTLCGGLLRPVALENEFVRLAVLHHIPVQFVSDAPELIKRGGVGGFLK